MKQMEVKNKVKCAGLCKHHREKNAEEYKINDALKKKRVRLLLKSNKDAYEERKRQEKERKCLAKHRKNFSISQPHLDQQPSQTSLSNSAVKSRTIKKVEKTLPQSLRKKERSNQKLNV